MKNFNLNIVYNKENKTLEIKGEGCDVVVTKVKDNLDVAEAIEVFLETHDLTEFEDNIKEGE